MKQITSAVMEILEWRFTSGNSDPVESVQIRQEGFEAIRCEIASLESTIEDYAALVDRLEVDIDEYIDAQPPI